MWITQYPIGVCCSWARLSLDAFSHWCLLCFDLVKNCFRSFRCLQKNRPSVQEARDVLNSPSPLNKVETIFSTPIILRVGFYFAGVCTQPQNAFINIVLGERGEGYGLFFKMGDFFADTGTRDGALQM